MGSVKLLQGIFQPTVLLAVALMAVIIMMILPVPSWVLDVGLATSFALAILIFTITLFISRPLDFSAFPTVLLASLMLRLSLNISSTKLIIGQGHTGTRAAGGVIEGFANFVMGGSIFLGLVVFCVLMIVNFIVITKGASRMAEVGARFALDAMPGKQLAIDSDLAAGAITHDQARKRRALEQQETTFFGSLDGASKFVKGDAIAGLLITLLNLLMGLVMGIVVHDLPLGVAFETYAILTVGDGLVTQIPAVIISIAAALLLARGGAEETTQLALRGQFGKHPAALVTVSAVMALLAFVPGLPWVPFMIGAVVLAGAAFVLIRRTETALPSSVEEIVEPAQKSFGDILELDEIHVEFSPDLVPLAMDSGTGLDARITNMRLHIARSFGVLLPEIRLTDEPSLPDGHYAIRLHGVEQVRAKLFENKVLVLLQGDGADVPQGVDVAEPVYGAAARWVNVSHREELALSGQTLILPAEVLATHLLETIKRNFSRILTLKMLRNILTEMTNLSDSRRADANQRFLDDMIPEKVTPELLLRVCRLLLDEQVSVRNMTGIIEAIADARAAGLTLPELICDHVRQRLGYQLVSALKHPDGSLPLVQLSPDWEDVFETYQMDGAQNPLDIALPPDKFHRLTDNIAMRLKEVADAGVYPAVISSARRRRFLRTIMAAKGISNPVLSYEEIGTEARPSLMGTVPI
jgi:flagellar biosynthesis protein FlhA